MKVMRRMTVIKTAIALAAVLAMNGTGWAKKGFAGPGLAGDLNGNTVTVDVTVPTKTEALCPVVTPPPVGTTISYSYIVTTYIFQPSGRMFGIALGGNTTDPFTCDTNADEVVSLQLQVLPGLTLKPGPATLLYKVTETTTTTTIGGTTTGSEVIWEYGSRVDLH